MSALVQSSTIRREIAEAKSLSDHGLIDAKLSALQKLVQRDGNDRVKQNAVAELRLVNIRKGGRMLLAMEKNRGAANKRGATKAPRYKDLGFAPTVAKRWQAVGRLPDKEFDERIKHGMASELIVSQFIKETKKRFRKQAVQQREAEALESIKANGGPHWKVTPDQSVIQCGALITDPPYGILDEPWEPERLEKFTRTWARRWSKCNADLVLIFWSQAHLWIGRQWLDESLAGYQFQQLLVWHYPNNKSPQSRMGFKQTWEPIFFYRKAGCSRQILVSSSEWGGGLNDFDCHVAAVPQENFNDAEMKQHPAQKPVSVMRWLINATTQPGELVCDPFCGSGTTGIAAAQLHRRFHGIETDEKFLKLAKQRIATYGI